MQKDYFNFLPFKKIPHTQRLAHQKHEKNFFCSLRNRRHFPKKMFSDFTKKCINVLCPQQHLT